MALSSNISQRRKTAGECAQVAVAGFIGHGFSQCLPESSKFHLGCLGRPEAKESLEGAESRDRAFCLSCRTASAECGECGM